MRRKSGLIGGKGTPILMRGVEDADSIEARGKRTAAANALIPRNANDHVDGSAASSPVSVYWTVVNTLSNPKVTLLGRANVS